MNLLLTGRPGVGKTTVIRRTLAHLGLHADGFYTEEIRGARGRLGFRITGLDGASGILAHVDYKGPHRVSKYCVNVNDIRRVAVAALERALREADVIVADEIGRMEAFCPEFREMIVRCLDSPKPVLGTIQARPHPWIDSVRARADTEVVEVTPANRDALSACLARRIEDCAR